MNVEMEEWYQEKNEEQIKRQSSDKEDLEEPTKRQSLDTQEDKNTMITLLKLLMNDN